VEPPAGAVGGEPESLSADFSYQRERMVRLVASRGVKDARVLQALRDIPRHVFVPGEIRSQAYGDHALPIGSSQTISQPYIVAQMTAMLELQTEHSVLEVGTGSGYQTAILAKLARRVFSLERVPALAHRAIQRIRELGLENVKIQTFDGSIGWSEMAPFDRIIVTAGAPKVPQPLLDQLAVGGQLVIPEGGRELQRLVVYRKTKRGIRRQEGEAVIFVPLIGRHGWQES
jgi:protein-L-isoaspartate(D-aspartate) O-methyltransferase